MIEPIPPTLAVNQTATKLCYYRNVTSQIQIIRVDPSIPHRLERTVFPGERLLFYFPPEAALDIYTNTLAGLTLIERVPCAQLQVLEAA